MLLEKVGLEKATGHAERLCCMKFHSEFPKYFVVEMSSPQCLCLGAPPSALRSKSGTAAAQGSAALLKINSGFVEVHCKLLSASMLCFPPLLKRLVGVSPLQISCKHACQ